MNDDIFGGFNRIVVERDHDLPTSSTWTPPYPAAFLQDIFDAGDPTPAKEQADAKYAHGGGWRPMKGWILSDGGDTIKYPGDPAMARVSTCHLPLSNETLILYDAGFVAIIQENGSFEVARMD